MTWKQSCSLFLLVLCMLLFIFTLKYCPWMKSKLSAAPADLPGKSKVCCMQEPEDGAPVVKEGRPLSYLSSKEAAKIAERQIQLKLQNEQKDLLNECYDEIRMAAVQGAKHATFVWQVRDPNNLTAVKETLEADGYEFEARRSLAFAGSMFITVKIK